MAGILRARAVQSLPERDSEVVADLPELTGIYCGRGHLP